MNNARFSFEYERFYIIAGTIYLLAITDGFTLFEEISYDDLITYTPNNEAGKVMIVYCGNCPSN